MKRGVHYFFFQSGNFTLWSGNMWIFYPNKVITTASENHLQQLQPKESCPTFRNENINLKKKNQQKLWNIIKITQTFNFTLQTYQNLQITRSLPHLQIVLKMTFMPFRVQYFYFFYLQMLRLVEVLGQSQWCFAH